MSDQENAASPQEVRSDETPPIPPPPLRLRKRDLRIGGGGIGLGIIVGVLGTLLIASVASGARSARGELDASATPSAVKTSPMTDAAKACNVLSNDWITVGDAGQSISMKSNGKKSLGADIDDLACVLGELHTPDSVISRIDSTRALDGRQTAAWKDFSASWGYHPDSGLDIVIEVVQK